ncbi:phosphohexomutase domain-containing protein [Vibrio algarum]|uniref:phosphomannomutase n=1 Tax=Vibrio algarum TaxID=3020714 RepID=A0ABT4YQA9_9VIBR|nr:phosphomannomutase CpsG [Vibrio sp. KJ40-1]MDB1123739.1 phosphomannomutase CpsG [Vibrio sp. KJ40-1]
MTQLTCFKSNDIRGRLSDEITPDIAYRIGLAFADHLKPSSIVVGCDGTVASNLLKDELVQGLVNSGVDVIDLGLLGKEELFYSLVKLNPDGALMVSSAVSLVNCYVVKLLGKDLLPINAHNGLLDIKHLVQKLTHEKRNVAAKGRLEQVSYRQHYVDRLFDNIAWKDIKPMKLVVNTAYGVASEIIDELETRFRSFGIPISLIKLHHRDNHGLDTRVSDFPLFDIRLDTAKLVVASGADMGISWDNDFNRCFIFDDKGRYVEPYYMVGLLAEAMLLKHPGMKVVHDHVLYWNTRQVIAANGGIPVAAKRGRTHFQKEMLDSNALYGGESSAYHYFKDFTYCGSGMIPWLIIAEYMSATNQKLSIILSEKICAYPTSGEIKITSSDPKLAVVRLLNYYKTTYSYKNLVDGIGLEFEDYSQAWRFNLRMSTKLQVLKLNVEADSDKQLVDDKVREVIAVLKKGSN